MPECGTLKSIIYFRDMKIRVYRMFCKCACCVFWRVYCFSVQVVENVISQSLTASKQTSHDPEARELSAKLAFEISRKLLADLGLPGAQNLHILSGTHEQTGFFQVRANMSSHFKIAKKSGSFSALFSKKKERTSPQAHFSFFFTLNIILVLCFALKIADQKSGPLRRADQKSGSFFISLKNRAHFSEQEAEMNAKNEWERTPPKKSKQQVWLGKQSPSDRRKGDSLSVSLVADCRIK